MTLARPRRAAYGRRGRPARSAAPALLPQIDTSEKSAAPPVQAFPDALEEERRMLRRRLEGRDASAVLVEPDALRMPFIGMAALVVALCTIILQANRVPFEIVVIGWCITAMAVIAGVLLLGRIVWEALRVTRRRRRDRARLVEVEQRIEAREHGQDGLLD